MARGKVVERRGAAGGVSDGGESFALRPCVGCGTGRLILLFGICSCVADALVGCVVVRLGTQFKLWAEGKLACSGFTESQMPAKFGTRLVDIFTGLGELFP